ncbi:MAG TPA: hypothetical protein DHW70_02650 [Candidatus Atribacteria bacterium]|nr:hypothetical protein [Candidatus Atribacteria bacterium]
MRQISNLEQKIRDYVNNANLLDRYFYNRPDDEWMALCVSMNTLGDTCQAIEYYEDYGLGDDYSEKYLKLYGLLQAIFLQQNSISQIYQIFLGKDLIPKPNSAWKKIRDLRHLTVGHPEEKKHKNETKRCFISRVTIQNNGFDLMIWNKKKGVKEFEKVDLKTLYEEYKTVAVKYLNNICKAQITKWGSL